jgi:hypothetical protein
MGTKWQYLRRQENIITLVEKAASLTKLLQHNHLTLARHAKGVAREDQLVDILMCTFSSSYYANLFWVLEFLKVEI